MRLYIIRHGETTWNAQGKIQGTADIPLNENGIRLARVTGERLRAISFDVAISSPLQRALVTAKLVLGERDIPIYTDKRIQEIDFGALEGKPVMKADPNHPFHTFFRDAYNYQPAPGGETIRQVCERTGEFYQELIHNEKLQDKTILIATHGCALQGILANVYEDNTDYWHGGVCPNCGVNIVDVENGKSKIVEENAVYY